MKDPNFIAKLIKLFSGNLKDEVQSKPTRAEAATCFLDKVVGPAVELDDDEPFSILLSVMETFGNLPLKKLSEEINKAKRKTDPVLGKLSVKHLHK